MREAPESWLVAARLRDMMDMAVIGMKDVHHARAPQTIELKLMKKLQTVEYCRILFVLF